MVEFTIFKMGEMEIPSVEELKKQDAADRKAYYKMLRELCPSEDMRKEAKRISKRKDACLTCVYYKAESDLSCLCPYSDGYMEDLNIDPCYEGVLRYLVESAQSNTAEHVVDKDFEALKAAPFCLQKMAYNDNNMIIILSDIIIKMALQNIEIPETVLDIVRKVRNSCENTSPLYRELFENGNTQ